MKDLLGYTLVFTYGLFKLFAGSVSVVANFNTKLTLFETLFKTKRKGKEEQAEKIGHVRLSTTQYIRLLCTIIPAAGFDAICDEKGT